MEIKEDGALLLHIDPDRVSAWAAALASELKGRPIRIWPERGDPEEIRYALLWRPPPALFDDLRYLEVIFSVGAGVDHLVACSTLPQGVPVVRMVEPVLTAGMVEYVVFNVIRFHRRMDEYERQQKSGDWQVLLQARADEITVGIMGLGVLGQAAASILTDMNYRLVGWSRTRKKIPGVQSFAGRSELPDFLSESQILVILLPFGADTRHIISRKAFCLLPSGAFIINAGRGGLVDENDLLSALDTGQVAGAALDVFENEPLSLAHPFWKHPGVYITPHAASLTNPVTAVRFVAENIMRHQKGQPLEHVAVLSAER